MIFLLLVSAISNIILPKNNTLLFPGKNYDIKWNNITGSEFLNIQMFVKESDWKTNIEGHNLFSVITDTHNENSTYGEYNMFVPFYFNELWNRKFKLELKNVGVDFPIIYTTYFNVAGIDVTFNRNNITWETNYNYLYHIYIYDNSVTIYNYKTKEYFKHLGNTTKNNINFNFDDLNGNYRALVMSSDNVIVGISNSLEVLTTSTQTTNTLTSTTSSSSTTDTSTTDTSTTDTSTTGTSATETSTTVTITTDTSTTGTITTGSSTTSSNTTESITTVSTTTVPSVTVTSITLSVTTASSTTASSTTASSTTVPSETVTSETVTSKTLSDTTKLSSTSFTTISSSTLSISDTYSTTYQDTIPIIIPNNTLLSATMPSATMPSATIPSATMPSATMLSATIPSATKNLSYVENIINLEMNYTNSTGSKNGLSDRVIWFWIIIGILFFITIIACFFYHSRKKRSKVTPVKQRNFKNKSTQIVVGSSPQFLSKEEDNRLHSNEVYGTSYDHNRSTIEGRIFDGRTHHNPVYGAVV